MKVYGAWILVFVALLAGQSCKKGCTNSGAINYDPEATSEDASCLYCDSVPFLNYDQLFTLQDFTSPSSWHFQETVLEIRTTGKSYQYRGNHCKALGNAVTCDTESAFSAFGYFEIKLKNLISDTMFISGTFELFVNGVGFNSETENDTTFINFMIPPNETVTYAKALRVPCIQSSFASANFSPVGSSGAVNYSYK